MLNQTIKVLVIEDDKQSAKLITTLLEREIYNTYIIEVRHTLKEGLKILKGNSDSCPFPQVDVVLLDLVLPNGEGFEVFSRVQAHCPDLPVIIISGHKDRALECVQCGAQDYLMKQNISTEVLSMAITHSIERKKLELKYRRLVESTNACIYEIDFKENKFLYCNDVCCDLTGYTKNEIMKLPPEAILTPNSVKKWYKRFERMAKGESIDSSETYQIVKKDGTTGYALINADYRKDDYGNILGARVIAIDVTERVLREKQLRTIFKTAPVGIGMTTIDRNFIEVNERFCNMVEMNREDLIGINARIIYPSDEEYKRVGEIKYDKIRIGEVGTLETQIKTKSGKLIDVLLSSSYTNPENPNEGVIFTMLDLTSVKEAEKEVSKVLEEKINAWRSEISDIRGVEQLDKILSMRI